MSELDAPIVAKFHGQRSERVVTAIITTRGILDGWQVNPLEIDAVPFLALGGAVLINHDGQRQVAWTSRLDRTASEMTAEATFPRAGVDSEADRIFSLVWNRTIQCASIGLKFRRGARPTLLEWSFTANGGNKECRILRGFRPDDSFESGAHFCANIRQQEAERRMRQYRMD